MALLGNTIISGSLSVFNNAEVFGTITGNLNGTASYATTAFTASYAPTNGERGIISASAFQGTPYSASVYFNNPFNSTIYVLSVVGEDNRGWSVSNRTTTGFQIETNSNQVLTGYVFWRAEEI